MSNSNATSDVNASPTAWRFYRTVPSNSSIHPTASQDVFGVTPSANAMFGSPLKNLGLDESGNAQTAPDTEGKASSSSPIGTQHDLVKGLAPIAIVASSDDLFAHYHGVAGGGNGSNTTSPSNMHHTSSQVFANNSSLFPSYLLANAHLTNSYLGAGEGDGLSPCGGPQQAAENLGGKTLAGGEAVSELLETPTHAASNALQAVFDPANFGVDASEMVISTRTGGPMDSLIPNFQRKASAVNISNQFTAGVNSTSNSVGALFAEDQTRALRQQQVSVGELTLEKAEVELHHKAQASASSGMPHLGAATSSFRIGSSATPSDTAAAAASLAAKGHPMSHPTVINMPTANGIVPVFDPALIHLAIAKANNPRDVLADAARHGTKGRNVFKGNLTDKIKLGICCMRKKLNSPTMDAMLERFEGFGNFLIVRFEEEMILNEPPTRWPTVDVMIAFFSSGFPLEKAVAYSDLHPHIFFITEPRNQRVLLDRRDVYNALRMNNVPHPKVLFCNRDGYRELPDSVFEEHDDYIIVDGQRLGKPFVEKPVSSEDHSVQVYYKGGGMRKLFRKVGNKSSDYFPDTTTVRRDGSYIYEEFIEAEQKRDIKCYTVGPGYVFAEARKAPTGDGVVLRREDGKEMREPIALRGDELMAARKLIKVFRQIVCGFDILRRADGKFFVCDVNGWSFVKNVPEYVDHATAIMRDIFVEEVRKRGLHREFRNKTMQRTLLGVVGVMRHADRTPKQKVKIVVNVEPLLLAVFDGERKVKEEIVFKSGHPKLDAIHDVVCALLSSTPNSICSEDTEDDDCGHNRCEAKGTITPMLSTSGACLPSGIHARTHSSPTPMSASLCPQNGGPVHPIGSSFPKLFSLPNTSPPTRPTFPASDQPCLMSNTLVCDDSIAAALKTQPSAFSTSPARGGPPLPPPPRLGQSPAPSLGVGLEIPADSFGRDNAASQKALASLETHHTDAPLGLFALSPPIPNAHDTDVISPLRAPMGTVITAPGSNSMDEAPTAGTGGDVIKPAAAFQSIASVANTAVVGSSSAAGVNHSQQAVNFSVRTGDNISKSILGSLKLMRDVLARQHEGLKVQVKPREWDSEGNCIEALLVCKWGGWLTDAGHKQSQMMGRHFLKRIFGVNELTNIQKSQYVAQTNNERRVIHTAVEFSSAMLGEPFDEKRCTVNENLLGKTLGAKEAMAAYAVKIKHIFNANDETEIQEFLKLPGMSNIVNCPVVPDDKRTPRGAMQTMRSLIEALCQSFAHSSTSQVMLYRDESMALLRQRWTNLLNALYQKKTDTFDTTKIPDVFDNISYDVCYNQRAFKNQLDMYPLFTLAEAMSTFISDGEFGITPSEKRKSAMLFATPLLEKISEDLRQIANRQGPSMRMYFTSESHVTGLKNLLYNSSEHFLRMEEPMELHFLSHFVFKLYRYPGAEPEKQYQIEVHFSMGMDKNMFGIVQEHHVDYASVTPMIRIHNNLDLEKLHLVATQFASEANTASSSPGASPFGELDDQTGAETDAPINEDKDGVEEKKEKKDKKKKKGSDDDDD